jgi:NifU-like protein involved in Fe-S cluster formation
MKKNKPKIKNTCRDGENWIYSPEVREHFFFPKNVLFDETNYRADGVGSVGSPACGDIMNVWIKVNKKTKRIKECMWRTFGCASAIASASMMSVMATENGGMDLETAQNLKPKQIVDRLGGLPDRKFHCSVLGHEALKQAVINYLENK